jgi:uncharacterized protein (DUF608 family)
MDRRCFLRTLAVGGAATLMPNLPAVAAPESEDEALIPWDKKLDPAWVASLFDRGEREVRRGEELRYIGMPIGGLCAGTLYIGGDGKLWLWDVLNRVEAGPGIRAKGGGGDLYVRPLEQTSPLEQGFAVRLKVGARETVRKLDRSGFSAVEFVGEYPIGQVRYRDPEAPVAVDLEAFSPFIPLDTEGSSFPATVLRYTVTNTGAEQVECEVLGWLENAIGHYTAPPGALTLRNTVSPRPEGGMALTCSSRKTERKPGEQRPDILFDDFEGEAYEGWEVEGTAFGMGPIRKADIPAYQVITRIHGERMVNSHSTAPGADVGTKDNAKGRMLSRLFRIERRFIRFLIGGGRNPGLTCLNLLVDGQVVASETGQDNNELRDAYFDTRRLEGKEARLEIVDAKSGSWGNIGVDWIRFSDSPVDADFDPESAHDVGTMTLACPEPEARGAARAADPLSVGLDNAEPLAESVEPEDGAPIGAVGVPLKLAPGESGTVRFVLAWHFPNLELPGLGSVGRHYAARFADSEKVADALLADVEELTRLTRLWRDTWYADSTLPYWVLNRTFLNTSILATETAFRFRNGRFYGNEGIGCCQGTCGHVWQYGQAMGRLFPDLERDLRERVDLGIGLAPGGAVQCRGEFGGGEAIDGEAAVVLRALRDHQMSPDDAFLRRTWDRLRMVIRRLLEHDGNDDGILEGAQENTLDAAWFGRIPWISGLYIAALRAGAALASEVGEERFASRLAQVADAGRRNIEQLFNGEYYIQIADAAHEDAIGVGTGCEIDQVYGQSWAFQVGLGRVLEESSTRSALRSLWRYSFCLDVGPYRERHREGRTYAIAGDAGLLMCTWPKGGVKPEWEKQWSFMYFNECMSGFEHQVAGHMLWEGMVTEGLAVERAIHDRYRPSRRNPYNEIECSDHYARAMASYGVFLAACGWEYHGPRGYLAFAPRLSPERFSAAFTAAEGWGTIGQVREGGTQTNTVEPRWGRLTLRTLGFERGTDEPVTEVRVSLDGREVAATASTAGRKVRVALDPSVVVEAGQRLEVVIR